jgi:hypothetical protein
LGYLTLDRTFWRALPPDEAFGFLHRRYRWIEICGQASMLERFFRATLIAASVVALLPASGAFVSDYSERQKLSEVARQGFVIGDGSPNHDDLR